MTTPEQTAWLRANKATKAQTLKPGAAVRGAPSRASADWVGIVIANEPLSGDRPYWMVRWMEREQSPIAALARCPTIGHLTEQLILITE
jgi:hypothetical protein